MPTFIDRHSLAVVSFETRHRLRREAMHGLVDPSGTKPLAHWIEDGVIYCVLQAPDRTAVCAHHAHLGLSCDDVHPMTDLHEIRPTSREDQAVVRAAIDRLWHTEPGTPSAPPTD
jgi:Protein of unknown function (DUF4242)